MGCCGTLAGQTTSSDTKWCLPNGLYGKAQARSGEHTTFPSAPIKDTVVSFWLKGLRKPVTVDYP